MMKWIQPLIFLKLFIKAADTLNKEGFEVTAVKIDVRDSAGLKNACTKIADRYGQIDILVNAAGTGVLKYLLDATDDFRDFTLDINYKGTWNACNHICSK